MLKNLYGPVSWSPTKPHRIFTEKWCWHLLAIVPCAFSWAHKWEFLVYWLHCG